MPTRLRLAVSLALVLFGASALADTTDDIASPDEAPPVMVTVTSVEVLHVGEKKDDPAGTFGLINAKESACYVLAPPFGADVSVGEKYALIVASDIDEKIREKIAADHPRCQIVDAVARLKAT